MARIDRLDLSYALRSVSTSTIVGSHALRTHIIAGLYVVAGILGGISVFFSELPPNLWLPVLIIDTLPTIVGIGIFLLWKHIHPLLTHVFILLGTFMVGWTATLHIDDGTAVATAAFLLLAVLTGAMYTWWQTLAYTLIVSAVIFVSLTLSRPHLSLAAFILVVTLWFGTAVVGAVIRLASTSTQDALTGTLNRQGFEQRYTDTLADAWKKDAPVSLVMIDIDNFDTFNAVEGAAAGDSILKTTAKHWLRNLPSGCLLARMGSDEFVVLLPGHTTTEARAVVDTLRNTGTTISFSAGITTWREHEREATIRRRATDALEQAKRDGRGHTATLHGPQNDLRADLAAAITNGEISVKYQPLVDLTHPGQVIGVEALARWVTDDNTSIPPSVFIPVAEAEGLITSLGSLVARTAMTDIAALSDPVKLFLNISGVEFMHKDFTDTLLRTMQDTAFPPRQLVLEVTETTLEAQANRAKDSLRALTDLGVEVAIDDFGTGYSSLSRLHSMPANYLKLDREFVRGIADDKPSPLLAVIAAMGRALGLPIIAEGVESADQAATLKRLGYAIGQGWLYHRDMTVTDLRDQVLSSPDEKRQPAMRPSSRLESQ